MSDYGNLIWFNLSPEFNKANLHKFLSFLGFNDSPSNSTNKMRFILETKNFPEVLNHHKAHFLILSNFTDRGLVVSAQVDEKLDINHELLVMIPFSNIISIHKHILD